MSFLGLGGSGGSGQSSGPVNAERMEMAMTECVDLPFHPYRSTDHSVSLRLDMVTDLFNKLVACVAIHMQLCASADLFLVRTCHNKCISARYAEPDLNKGESVCIDRCVAKYFEVNKKVGEKLQAVGANAQGGAAGGASNSFGGF